MMEEGPVEITVPKRVRWLLVAMFAVSATISLLVNAGIDPRRHIGAQSVSYDTIPSDDYQTDKHHMLHVAEAAAAANADDANSNVDGGLFRNKQDWTIGPDETLQVSVVSAEKATAKAIAFAPSPASRSPSAPPSTATPTPPPPTPPPPTAKKTSFLAKRYARAHAALVALAAREGFAPDTLFRGARVRSPAAAARLARAACKAARPIAVVRRTHLAACHSSYGMTWHWEAYCR